MAAQSTALPKRRCCGFIDRGVRGTPICRQVRFKAILSYFRRAAALITVFTMPAPDTLAASELYARAFARRPDSIVAMPGGASTRLYFRLSCGNDSAVAMFVPDATRADEIQNGPTRERWPFLEVRDLLEERGVRVPRVLAESCDDGWLLLEDLSDLTLANYLLEHPRQKEAAYVRAVDDLARAQTQLASLPESSIVHQRRFDEKLLSWEVDHFREWGLEARGYALPPGTLERWDALRHELAARVAAMPTAFVHRDYQSRNLMVTGETLAPELVWIDFQDALIGPRVYDLVALLGDSYQSFEPAFVQKRVAEFAAAIGVDHRVIRREFDEVTVQRKLKDAGRFVFIDRVKGNPHFLQYVEPTIDKVFAALNALSGDPLFDELRGLLATSLPR